MASKGPKHLCRTKGLMDFFWGLPKSMRFVVVVVVVVAVVVVVVAAAAAIFINNICQFLRGHFVRENPSDFFLLISV